MSDEITLREKVRSTVRMIRYRPLFTAGIILFSFLVALLEGIGLSFIVPIVELLQDEGDPGAEADGFLELFVVAFQTLGIPFTLEYVIAGVAVVMALRFSASFCAEWLKEKLIVGYMRDLQLEAFEAAIGARVGYFDDEGSDTVLNAIVTQAPYAGTVIHQFVTFFERSLLCGMYLLIALYLAPSLTVLALLLLGGITYLLREVIEPGYDIGDRVATTNEQIQSAAQRGTQGIRDVKLFEMGEEVYRDFARSAHSHAEAAIVLRRNDALIKNGHRFLSALVIFGLIYVGYRFAALSLGALGVFLFAMFRLAPQVSNLSQLWYRIEGTLPHLVRTHSFIESLSRHEEGETGSEPLPETIDRIAFENVTFAYEEDTVLRDVSFHVERGEFVAFVGQSGAGKSTIASLIARLYDPDSGCITANETPITDFDVQKWRSRIALIQQNPFIFNDTLRYNLTIGNRDASEDDIDRACEIASVTEFLEQLPNGYETKLGDDGVKLSGGQRQRVAIARALLKKEAEILVLDEATSELDSDIERAVHRGIDSMQDEYTILAIAHRLSTVTSTDRIYTVSDGRIVQSGTHDELVDSDGFYSRLYALQS